MYEVKFTTAFKKSYKLMKKRGLDISLLDDVVDKLRQGIPLEEKYKDHGLSGNYEGFRECHIKPDWLLIYLIGIECVSVLLQDISENHYGTPHDYGIIPSKTLRKGVI